MNTFIVSFMSLALTVVPCARALAYAHANRFGGSTAHAFGATTHTSAFGTRTSHIAGVGTSHTNVYGGRTSHSYYGGTSHTNAWGGATAGAVGHGAVHTTPYGATAYGSAYRPPGAYYGYHPPTAVGYYGARCYNCSSGGAAGAALVGGAVGLAAGAAASSRANAASADAASASANAAAATASAAAAVATAGVGYTVGSVHAALPGGCITPSVAGGGTYYLCGNTWFSPSFGANGVYYRVVPAP